MVLIFFLPFALTTRPGLLAMIDRVLLTRVYCTYSTVFPIRVWPWSVITWPATGQRARSTPGPFPTKQMGQRAVGWLVLNFHCIKKKMLSKSWPHTGTPLVGIIYQSQCLINNWHIWSLYLNFPNYLFVVAKLFDHFITFVGVRIRLKYVLLKMMMVAALLWDWWWWGAHRARMVVPAQECRRTRSGIDEESTWNE